MNPNRCQQCEHRDGGKCIHPRTLELAKRAAASVERSDQPADALGRRLRSLFCITSKDEFQPKRCPLTRCIELVGQCGISGCPDCCTEDNPCGGSACPKCSWGDMLVPLDVVVKQTRMERLPLKGADEPATVKITGCLRGHLWASADDRVVAAAVGLVDEWRANDRNPSHERAQELMAAVDERTEVKAREEARKS